MAEGETLKLPKQVSELRPELLTFSEERRWDLLEFVRSDDVAEIKACNLGPVSAWFSRYTWNIL